MVSKEVFEQICYSFFGEVTENGNMMTVSIYSSSYLENLKLQEV